MIDGNQNVVAKYAYDPFGNTLSSSGTLADVNTYRFSSQVYHQPSGLLFYLYRAYDPTLQRFINRDPIEEAGGINLYGFVGNNPIIRNDPLGLWWEMPTWMDQDGIPHYGTPPSEQPPEKQCTYGAMHGMDNNFNGKGMEDLTRDVVSAVPKGIANACMMFCPVGGAGKLGTAGKELKTAETVVADAAKIKKAEDCIKAAKEVKLLGTARDNLLNAAQNPRLRDAINNLYRLGAKLGSGSSMDALRIEGSHLKKLFDRQTQLRNILREEQLNPGDKQIVKDLLNDIQNAITEHYGK